MFLHLTLSIYFLIILFTFTDANLEKYLHTSYIVQTFLVNVAQNVAPERIDFATHCKTTFPTRELQMR